MYIEPVAVFGSSHDDLCAAFGTDSRRMRCWRELVTLPGIAEVWEAGGSQPKHSRSIRDIFSSFGDFFSNMEARAAAETETGFILHGNTWIRTRLKCEGRVLLVSLLLVM